MNLFHKIIDYGKTSGPGWLQAAVTLGGGSLVGALYLGVIGGYKFLWLQPLAMICGVIMLSALSYISLSKENIEDRPFKLVQRHISPFLAWGWLIATIIANIVFCSSQFALGADAIQGNLGGNKFNPFLISGGVFIVAMLLIWMFTHEGKGSMIIDRIIKFMVALIVLSFMGVVVTLMINNAIDWHAILRGSLPDFSALFRPTETYQHVLIETGAFQFFWEKYIIDQQRNIIIGAFGTAVGINMTFLLPYTLYKKKWGKSDRERSRFDLVLGLFIPFLIAASCLILATASQFHAQKDSVVSELAYNQVLDARLAAEFNSFSDLPSNEKILLRGNASQIDQIMSIMLAKRSANELALSLEPFLGDWAQLIFGIGVLAMALSTIIIHMMMNGYAISEALGVPGKKKQFLLGASIPALLGFFSPFVWKGTVKAALVVPASVIATTLLPIAYLAFLLLMNSRKALGPELPKKRTWVNLLMLFATAVAFFASFWALTGKYNSLNQYEHYFGLIGLIILPVLSVTGILRFFQLERKT